MSLELAWSKEIGSMVTAISAYDESISDDPCLTDSHAFKCLDENCSIPLTLVNFGNQNKVQKPRFEPSHRKGHKPECAMIYGTTIQVITILQALSSTITQKVSQQLASSPSGYLNIVEAQPAKIGKATDSSDSHNTEQASHDLFGLSNNKKDRKDQSPSNTVSALGTVFIAYMVNPKTIVNSINWPSYDHKGRPLGFDDNLIINDSFQIKDIVKHVIDANVPLNKTAIYYGNCVVNFSDDEKHLSFSLVDANSIQTEAVTWKELKGFPNIQLLHDAKHSRDDGKDFVFNVVLVGHFYKRGDSQKYIFMPIKPKVRSWLFIPDRKS